jgi:hypothetical protein
MEYFDEELDNEKTETINVNPSETSQEENDIISSIPEIEKNKEEIPAETIEISNKTVINHLKPQENKYWHFTFKNDQNKNQLTQTLQNIPGYSLTVDYGVPQNSPDITLKNNGKIVGKIHLLLCDRRDANMPEKYYCKIYFYHFINQELYQAVKTAVVNFFENFKNTEGGAKKNKPQRKIKTHKKKRTNKYKKSLKRRYRK